MAGPARVSFATLCLICAVEVSLYAQTTLPEPTAADQAIVPLIAPNIYRRTIKLDESSQAALYFADDPALDIFYRSFAAFVEERGQLFEQSPLIDSLPGWLNPATRLKFGLVSGSNLEHAVAIEHTLVMLSAQVSTSVLHRFYPGDSFYVDVMLEDDIFVRGAYNISDLAPSVTKLGQGYQLGAVFASYSSGFSYSTLQNRLSAGIKLGDDHVSAKLTWQMLMTDFLFGDHLIALSVTKGGTSAELAYDFASYDTLNSVPANTVIASVGFSGPFGALKFENRYRVDGHWSFAISGNVFLIDRNSDKVPKQSSRWFQHSRLSRSSAYAARSPTKETHLLATKPSYGQWNQALLKKTNLSLSDIGAILWGGKISQSYDYSRVFDLGFTSMKSPEYYINNGGVCRDAANATANILANNNYPARIVFTKRVAGSPHAFTATRDHDGTFYLLDYELPYRITRANSLVEAAASFSQFLNLYLIDPKTHRVTDVVSSSDSVYLESIAGIE